MMPVRGYDGPSVPTTDPRMLDYEHKRALLGDLEIVLLRRSSQEYRDTSARLQAELEALRERFPR